jgi:hypothetical protein
VEFRLRLKIEPCHSLLSQVGMVAFLKRDFSGIVVDHYCYGKEQYLPRMRFFFAHEMGHYFPHRDLYSRVLFRSPKEWKAFILTLPEEEYRAFEGQADAFAARLLRMPSEPVPPHDYRTDNGRRRFLISEAVSSFTVGRFPSKLRRDAEPVIG